MRSKEKKKKKEEGSRGKEKKTRLWRWSRTTGRGLVLTNKG